MITLTKNYCKLNITSLADRWGVYEKPFREMELGSLKLEKGKQEIYLRALQAVKGKEVAELKAVVLKKM